MIKIPFEVESKQLFSKSKIWQLNRDFYNFKGTNAFSEDIVPHHLTSNSFVGKTYAELIFGFLKDLGEKGELKEKVYILELGAGHGRLAFHILKHIEKLVQATNVKIPDYCYVLSDIVEENLDFFLSHPQFSEFYEKGTLDCSYFDAIGSENLYLRYAKKSINSEDLRHPLIAIANYFFDSIPNDLFYIKDKKIFNVSLSLESSEDPAHLNPEELIRNLTFNYHLSNLDIPIHNNSIINDILNSYKKLISDTYIFFPIHSMQCIEKLRNLSSEGLLVLSMDKGFHEIQDLGGKRMPDIVTHGSLSTWVNYHALGEFCMKAGGNALFPTYSTFHLEIASMLFLKDGGTYFNTMEAYEKFVNDFGPDDFNTLKHLSYAHVSTLDMKELIAFFRLSVYDSTIFFRLMPRLKQVIKSISYKERTRIYETMIKVWEGYFNIGESFDLAYEIGGVFYELGFYETSLNYFQNSIDIFGPKPDTYYNMALSHFQLREDQKFHDIIIKGREKFPDYEQFKNLDKLVLE